KAYFSSNAALQGHLALPCVKDKHASYVRLRVQKALFVKASVGNRMGLDWPGRSLLAAANPLDNVLRWEVAVLFAGFIIITVAWEWIMAFLSWFTLYTSGRKPLWLVRIKNEICALGVITLVSASIQAHVLFALTPSLATICIEGTADMSSLSTDYPEHQCPDGQRLLFTKHMIHDTHILLFTVAIVHILYTCATLYLALYRMNQWASWEYASRHGQPLDPGPSHLAACLGPTAWQHALRVLGWHSWSSALNHNMYSLLRVLFRLRIDEVARDGEHLPRQFNFLNILQQARHVLETLSDLIHMEYGFNESAEHSWAMTSVMAIFLALPSNLKGLYWMAGLSDGLWAQGICMWLASSKLQSVIIQLGATTYFDFKPILEDYIAEQRRRYRPLTRHATLDPALRKGPHHPLASFRTHLASMAHAAVALVSPAHGRSPSPPAPWEQPSPLTPASPPQGLPNNPTTTPQRGGQTTHAVPAFEPLASFTLGQALGSQPATPQRWLSVRGGPHRTAGAKGPVAEGVGCGPTQPGLTSEPLPPGLLLAGAAAAAAWGGSTRAGGGRAWAWASGGQKRNRVSPGPVAEGRAWSEGWDAGAGSGGPAAAAAAGGPGVAAPGAVQERWPGTLHGPLPPAAPPHLTPHLPHLAATSLTNITSLHAARAPAWLDTTTSQTHHPESPAASPPVPPLAPATALHSLSDSGFSCPSPSHSSPDAPRTLSLAAPRPPLRLAAVVPADPASPTAPGGQAADCLIPSKQADVADLDSLGWGLRAQGSGVRQLTPASERATGEQQGRYGQPRAPGAGEAARASGSERSAGGPPALPDPAREVPDGAVQAATEGPVRGPASEPPAAVERGLGKKEPYTLRNESGVPHPFGSEAPEAPDPAAPALNALASGSPGPCLLAPSAPHPAQPAPSDPPSTHTSVTATPLAPFLPPCPSLSPSRLSPAAHTPGSTPSRPSHATPTASPRAGNTPRKGGRGEGGLAAGVAHPPCLLNKGCRAGRPGLSVHVQLPEPCSLWEEAAAGATTPVKHNQVAPEQGAKAEGGQTKQSSTSLPELAEYRQGLWVQTGYAQANHLQPPARANRLQPPPAQVNQHTHATIGHRVAFHFVNSAQPGDRLQPSCHQLFWWKNPHFLMYLFQLSFMENCLSLCLISYGLYSDHTSFLEKEGWQPVAFLVLFDFLLLFFSAWCLLPVYAIAQTVSTSHPRRLIKELKRSKLVDEEETEVENGVGGFLLRMCLCGHLAPREGLEEPEAKALKDVAFIAMLAAQAGVVTAKVHGMASCWASDVEPVFRSFATKWLEHARQWAASSPAYAHAKANTSSRFRMCHSISARHRSFTRVLLLRQRSLTTQASSRHFTAMQATRMSLRMSGVGGRSTAHGPTSSQHLGQCVDHDPSRAEQALTNIAEEAGETPASPQPMPADGQTPEFVVSGDLRPFREAFDAIDTNENGALSSHELAQVLRMMGTRATVEELSDMVRELDRSGSDEISFQEFMLFIMFKWFDVSQDGFLWVSDIAAALRKLHSGEEDACMGMADAELLVDYVASLTGEARGRLELAEFMVFFADVSFMQVDGPDVPRELSMMRGC
ncbi:hypothetical protein QJQ45_022081, partial [Haematococcus lacustris]